jgi:hypothetical protein
MVCCRETTASVRSDKHWTFVVEYAARILASHQLVFDCDVPPNGLARLPASRAFFFIGANVRLGSKADIFQSQSHVRFTPKARTRLSVCLLKTYLKGAGRRRPHKSPRLGSIPTRQQPQRRRPAPSETMRRFVTPRYTALRGVSLSSYKPELAALAEAFMVGSKRRVGESPGALRKGPNVYHS